jgi:hypothetical protein
MTPSFPHTEGGITRRLPGILLAVGLSAAAALAPAVAQSHEAHAAGARADSSPLVAKVRNATAKYVDINVAVAEGWVRGTPCVSGPNEGAMGVHYILPSRVGDGRLDAAEPEALIYEPMRNGGMRLVAAEFIVLASDWAREHPDGGAPEVEGHLANYVGAPNRYGLPAFYELHVWAWENNPNGSFADWNTQVTCERQPLKAS